MQLFRVEGRRLGLFPPRGKIEMGALALPKSKAVHVSSTLNSYVRMQRWVDLDLATKWRIFAICSHNRYHNIDP